MSNVPLVTKFKCVKDETQTFFDWNDLADPIIKTMGFDMWDTIQILKDRELENGDLDPNTYIDDGVFAEQIDESGLVEELVKMVIQDLSEQGFIKKNKNIDNFKYTDVLYREIVDEKLSPGIINYFKG